MAKNIITSLVDFRLS